VRLAVRTPPVSAFRFPLLFNNLGCARHQRA
jgi:hypothetical protein